MRKLNLHCTCGSSWKGILPRAAAYKIEQEFNGVHCGEGHIRCKSAAAARRRRIEEKRAMDSLKQR